MAQDSDVSKSASKGKGKAVEADKVEDAKKAKDGQANGKKDDDKIVDGEAHGSQMQLVPALFANPKLAAEELSEEDQQLKNELDMLVERLTVRFAHLQHHLSISIRQTNHKRDRNPMRLSTSRLSRP